MKIGEPLPVDEFLHAGDADVIDIGEAEHMRADRAIGIDALVLGDEADAGQAKVKHLVALMRRHLALDPNEALFRGETFAQFARVDLRQRGGEQFGRLVLVDEAARLGEDRHGLHVGRENFAVAVEKIGTRGGHRLGRGAAQIGGVRPEAQKHQPAADDGVNRKEQQRDEANARRAAGEIRRESRSREGAQALRRAHPRAGRPLAVRGRRVVNLPSVHRHL